LGSLTKERFYSVIEKEIETRCRRVFRNLISEPISKKYGEIIEGMKRIKNGSKRVDKRGTKTLI